VELAARGGAIARASCMRKDFQLTPDSAARACQSELLLYLEVKWPLPPHAVSCDLLHDVAGG
jgi:hypothetical protein